MLWKVCAYSYIWQQGSVYQIIALGLHYVLKMKCSVVFFRGGKPLFREIEGGGHRLQLKCQTWLKLRGGKPLFREIEGGGIGYS